MRIESTIEEARREIYGTVDWDTDLKGNVYMSEKALVLSMEEHQEIVYAQDLLVKLLHTMQDIFAVNKDLNEWLDIPQQLFDLSLVDRTFRKLTTYGRFDWVFNNEGYLQLLEFNSETPMGWKESIEYTSKAHFYYQNLINMNCELREELKASIYDRLLSIGKLNGRIAIVGDLDDTEELDTFNFLADIVREINSDVVLCSVSELKAVTGYENIEDGIYIEKGELMYPIDTLMTFYSIEWLAKYEGGQQLIDLITSNKVALMNPTSTLQLHSKGLFALIWFLYYESNLLDEHEEVIESYIPYSTFDPREFRVQDGMCVQKKLNHREGSSVEIKPICQCSAVEDDFIVFQEYVDVLKQPFERLYRDNEGNVFKKHVNLQHTIGVYCVNDTFGGYYTRLSEDFCSIYDATFVPTFVEQN